MKASVIEMFLVLLATGIHSNKDMTKKIKRPKLTVPQINCDVKAGKIINPEFVVKCPAGCQDPKYHVYGTDIYASYSSVCGAAIHSGVLDNSGGKILVRKVAGQSGYKGSYSNGVQSLSLPRWRESFIVSEGKSQKGVTYPSALTYSSSKSPAAKTDEATKAYQKPPVPGTTAQPVTLTQVTGATATGAAHASLPKPSPSAGSTSSSLRPQPVGLRSGELDLWATSTYTSGQNSPRADPGIQSQDSPRAAFQKPAGTQVSPGEMDLWKPGSVLLDAGFVPKEELSTQALEPLSQGDPNCKIDLSFVIDGSSSIGKRRFRIQKQFLADVAQALDIGPAGPLMGIVQYGDNPSAQFNLRTHMNSRDLRTAIEKITQRGGLSNAGRAISFVTKNFFSKANGNRGSAPNVAVVIVDGWPTDKVEEASRFARESGINIFFITIEGATENEKQYVVEPNFSHKSWFSLHKTVQALVKRVCDTDRLACSKTCLNSADIGFVIDGSSSVGTGNFRTVLQFVANLSKEFEISDIDTRIGAVQYTYEQRLEFGFDDYNTKSDILNAIKRSLRGVFNSKMVDGLHVGQQSQPPSGSSQRSEDKQLRRSLLKVPNILKPNASVCRQRHRQYPEKRHWRGVITYAIGVAWAAQDELEVIATHPAKDHSFFVDEFDNLYKFVPKVIQNICTEFNSQPRN
ncbi:low quality protein: vitrin-like [Lynx pardinus]|uniref:Low quality protein: vitrin-like n=1 Tax=Lynx pardinus TaxID=191816 RepID=A0A485PQG4_LYNPA|nr:low quality protein: vitrin-like [Lynx pardinus]